VLPVRSGNVSVNPLRIVAKAGTDGSRGDRESCSQESTTAGGRSQLSRSRLVRCPCHGLHFLCVAESTQWYARVRRAPCSPAVRERWAHCHPFPTLPLCRAGATPGLAYAAARSVPEYPLPVARRAACGVRCAVDFPHFGAGAAGHRDGSASTARAARRCRAGAGASSGPRLTIAAADRLRLSGRLCSTFQWLST
jgi:hypothetical protein